MSLESTKEALLSRPGVALVVRAVRKGNKDYAKDMAASTAFFTFFSLFPLLIGIAAASSLFIDLSEAQDRIDRLLADTLPGSAEFVFENVEALVRLRGAAGVASILGLFWSASKMFGALSRGINRALDLERPHPSYLSRLRYFILTLTVTLLLFLVLAVPTGVGLYARLDLDLPGTRWDGLVSFASSHLSSYLFVTAVFAALYGLVPYKRLSWRQIVPAALVAALLFELGKSAFVFYLERVAHLSAVYGSLSSIIVLLLWLYITARILLFGAELIAAGRERASTAALQ